MKRISIIRETSGVSPVIATILNVAITVVLATTLYMLLPDLEGTYAPFTGNLRVEANKDEVLITFQKQGTPSKPEWDTLEIYIDGDLVSGYGEDDFMFLTSDGKLRSGSTLRLTSDIDYTEGGWQWPEPWEKPNEVKIFYDGYTGNLRGGF